MWYQGHHEDFFSYVHSGTYLLSQGGTFDRLFDKFRSYLDSLGLSFNEGKIIDATFVEAPRQHNTHEENRQIKEGNGKDLWLIRPHFA